MSLICGGELDFDCVLCGTLFEFIHPVADMNRPLVDQSNMAQDLVDALYCVFSSPCCGRVDHPEGVLCLWLEWAWRSLLFLRLH